MALLADSAVMSERSDSDMELVARPKKAILWCWIAAVAVLAMSVFVATTLRGATEGGGTFTTSDQYTMAGIGVIAAGVVLLFTRPRVWADANGIKIRNLVSNYDLPWEVVVAVRFPKGTSWAMLELADDELVPMMALQAVDRDYAVAATRRLRALLAEAKGE